MGGCKNIFRLLGCFLIILALCITMPIKNGFVPNKIEQNVLKKKSLSSTKTDKSSKSIIKASLPETFVPATQIHFLQIFFVSIKIYFPKSFQILNKVFHEPLFIHSYFKNTFCHHIAINAP